MRILQRISNSNIFRSILHAVIVPVMSAALCRGQSPAAESRNQPNRSTAPDITITVHAI